jgi:hypothetical protein
MQPDVKRHSLPQPGWYISCMAHPQRTAALHALSTAAYHSRNARVAAQRPPLGRHLHALPHRSAVQSSATPPPLTMQASHPFSAFAHRVHSMPRLPSVATHCCSLAHIRVASGLLYWPSEGHALLYWPSEGHALLYVPRPRVPLQLCGSQLQPWHTYSHTHVHAAAQCRCGAACRHVCCYQRQQST